MNSSQSIIINNITLLQKYCSLSTYGELSKKTHVNENTIKSWFSQRKISPRLTTLDKFCDALCIRTVDLFVPLPTFNYDKHTVNNSRSTFILNFKKMCIQKELLTATDIEYFFSDAISYDRIISYTRNANGRTIPIESLDIIADKFNIPTYQLLLP